MATKERKLTLMAPARKSQAVSETGEEDPAVLLSSYSETFLACRDLRHPWRSTGLFAGDRGDLFRVLVCDRCSTERTDHWSRDGRTRHPSSYRYPDSYRLTGGGVSAELVRHEIVTRLPIFGSRDEMLSSMFTKAGRPRKQA